ncbi:hypothetical protein ACJIZ3_004791 [Penstemon smallii]|uniref:RING-type domain-containing protein n=1 Tax=Penstemon smallii TaxID=265156 RepID=A0ABD3S338_9LAMI
MAALSELLAHIYCTTMVFFTILVFELVNFVRASAANHRRTTTATIFVKLVEENIPALKFKGVEPLECAVCLSLYEDGDEVRKLKCNHTFHKDCLDEWFRNMATCPLCRSMVLSEEEVEVENPRWWNHHYVEGSDDEELPVLSYIAHGNFFT